MKTDTCGQGLNKQNNNACTSNIFVHFSDFLTRMWREILSSDVLRHWRAVSYYTHTTVPSQNHIFDVLKFICQNVTRVSIRSSQRSSEKQLQVSLKWNILFSGNILKIKKNKTVVTCTANPPHPLSNNPPPLFLGERKLISLPFFKASLPSSFYFLLPNAKLY